MKYLKHVLSLLVCLALLPAFLSAPGMSDEQGLSEFRIDEKEDLSMMEQAAAEYLVYHGSGSITYCFSKKLVDAYTVDKLIKMVFKAGYAASAEDLKITYSTPSDGTLRVELSGLKIRSGEKMLEAYYFDDRSSLTQEEARCLDRVVRVMDDLMKKYPATSLELETAIYDYICDHVTYQNYPLGDSRRETCTSACNAFMKGWGNCQAYSDLFRLMATIGGFSTGLVSGEANNEAHMWNWIGTWFDGEYRVFMVDVTYGDKDGKFKTDHFWLNFGLDRSEDHTWFRELYMYDEFERCTNDSCTYYHGATGFTAQTLDDAARTCASLSKSGRRRVEFLILQNGIWDKEIESALRKTLGRGNWHFDCFRHDVGVSVTYWR